MNYTFRNFGFLNRVQMVDVPLVLYDFGIEKRKNEIYDWRNEARDHPGYVFQYTLRGCGALESSAGKKPLPPGTAFLIHFPMQNRYYLPKENMENGWEFLYLHFGGEAAKTFYEHITGQYGHCFNLFDTSSDTAVTDVPAIRIFTSYHERICNGYSPQIYENGEVLYRFLATLLRQLEAPYTKKYSAYTAKAIQMMNDDYGTIESIEQISNRLSLSFEYFTRLFHAETGQTPHKYLTNIRLHQAIYHLLNSNDSIQKIAELCGFSCSNYFSKVFYKHTGYSPTKYRNRNGRPSTSKRP